jgi:4-hydroxy-2-oxoheptanedioate aldolase
MPLRLIPTFREQLARANRPLVGMWVCSGSPLIAEICAGGGLDWLLIDMEHSPNGLESVLVQQQAVGG